MIPADRPTDTKKRTHPIFFFFFWVKICCSKIKTTRAHLYYTNLSQKFFLPSSFSCILYPLLSVSVSLIPCNSSFHNNETMATEVDRYEVDQNQVSGGGTSDRWSMMMMMMIFKKRGKKRSRERERERKFSLPKIPIHAVPIIELILSSS